MIVYIVIKGEMGEGGLVMGVYQRRDKACREALKTKYSFSAWIPKKGVRDEWESGCDFVSVERWKVE